MSRLRAFLAGALVVGMVSFISGTVTFAAFFSRTSNDANGTGTGNEIEGGTVDLTDNDLGGSMFTISNMLPTDPPVSSCITVTYNGSLDSVVGLYATVSGSLAPYLNLTVFSGDSSGVFGDCSGFSADDVLYNGTLDAFPAAYGPIMDPINPWSTGAYHSYQFTFSMQNTPDAQGLSASINFIWEARNL
jgi:hypothetical protein